VHNPLQCNWCWFTLDRFTNWIVDGAAQTMTSLTIAANNTTPNPVVSENWTKLYGDNFNCNGNSIQLDKSAYTISVNQALATTVQASLGGRQIAAINMTITYDPAFLDVNTSIGTSGISNFAPSAIVAVNATPGKIAMSAFEAGSGFTDTANGIFAIIPKRKWSAHPELKSGETRCFIHQHDSGEYYGYCCREYNDFTHLWCDSVCREWAVSW